MGILFAEGHPRCSPPPRTLEGAAWAWAQAWWGSLALGQEVFE